MPRTIKKLVPATTKNLTDAVVNYINLSGGFAFRVNTSGTYSESKRRWIRSGAKKGASDIMGTCNGHSFYIEIKNKETNDVPSDDQLQFEKDVKRVGAFHIFAKDFEEAKLFFEYVTEYSLKCPRPNFEFWKSLR